MRHKKEGTKDIKKTLAVHIQSHRQLRSLTRLQRNNQMFVVTVLNSCFIPIVVLRMTIR